MRERGIIIEDNGCMMMAYIGGEEREISTDMMMLIAQQVFLMNRRRCGTKQGPDKIASSRFYRL